MNPLELLKRAQYGSPNPWSQCLSCNFESTRSTRLYHLENCTPAWGVLNREQSKAANDSSMSPRITFQPCKKVIASWLLSSLATSHSIFEKVVLTRY